MQLRSQSINVSDEAVKMFVQDMRKKLEEIESFKTTETNTKERIKIQVSKIIEMLCYLISNNIWYHSTSKSFQIFRTTTNYKMKELSAQYSKVKNIISETDKKKFKQLIQQVEVMTRMK